MSVNQALDAVFATVRQACDLSIPSAWQLPVGIVGAGGVVRNGHLPAYAAAGVPVAAIHDKDPSRADAIASDFGLPRVYAEFSDMLDDGRIPVVDVAVPAAAQAPIVRSALLAGKHVLAQKPLSLDVDTAAELVELAREVSCHLVVNQQLRYADVVASPTAMIRAGLIGDPTVLTITIRAMSNWEDWPWLHEAQRLDLINHSIHYVDAARYILGDPAAAYCATGRRPGQFVAGETMTTSVLTYDDERRAVIDVNGQSLPGDGAGNLRIEGSKGAIRVALGSESTEARIELWNHDLATRDWISYPVHNRWFPDAFIGPLRSLFAAVATGTTPPTSGADNLKTIQLIDALYRSADENAVQRLGP